MSKSIILISSLLAVSTAGEIDIRNNTGLSDNELKAVQIPIRESGGTYIQAKDNEEHIPLGKINTAKLPRNNAKVANTILTSLSKAYQKSGFYATRFVMLPKDYKRASSTGSDLAIYVQEKRVKKVKVTLDKQFKDGLQSFWKGTKERIEKVVKPQIAGLLQPKKFQNNIDLLNRHPRRHIQPLIQVDKNKDLLVEYKVRELKPYQFHVFANNYGPESIGELRYGVHADFYNLANLDGHYFMGYTTSENSVSQGAYVGGKIAVDKLQRQKIGFTASHSSYQISELGSQLGVSLLSDGEKLTGSATSFNLNYTHNIYAQDKLFVDFVIGAEWMNVKSDRSALAGSNAELFDLETNYLLPQIGFTAGKIEQNQWWNTALNLKFNLPGVAGTAEDIGTDIELSRFGRFGAENDFTLLTFSGAYTKLLAQRKHQFDTKWSATQNLTGNRLPANFLTVLGDGQTLRGYPTAVVSGDSGAFATLEYKYNVTNLFDGGNAKVSSSVETDKLSVKAFVDVGAIQTEDKLATEKDEFLSSVGIGVDWNYQSNLSLTSSLGMPLQSVDLGVSDSVEKGSVRFNVGINFSF